MYDKLNTKEGGNLMNCTEKLALNIRYETAKLIQNRGYGHLGSMSIIETLAVLYDRHINFNISNPNWEKRDWFILSKGHSCASYYAVLALKGFFSREELKNFNQNGGNLPSHPNRKKTLGVDCTTGSLGQGISQAVGIALGLKIQKKSQYVYCIVGDGECNEGEVWEAFLMAIKYKLDHLIIFIDNNKKQSDGKISTISGYVNYEKVMDSLGFYTQMVNGHDINEIDEAICNAKRQKDKCSIIVLDTIKGCGIPYLEKLESNHHIKLTDKKIENAFIQYIKELEEKYELEIK